MSLEQAHLSTDEVSFAVQSTSISSHHYARLVNQDNSVNQKIAVKLVNTTN